MSTTLVLFILGALAVICWFLLEAFKIKNGYPTTDSWGRTVKPDKGGDTKLLEQENAALKEQLDTVHNRLETLERIVTDRPSRLEAEIDALKSLSDTREKDKA